MRVDRATLSLYIDFNSAYNIEIHINKEIHNVMAMINDNAKLNEFLSKYGRIKENSNSNDSDSDSYHHRASYCHCSFMGCPNNSAIGNFQCMSLRMGTSMCFDHVELSNVIDSKKGDPEFPSYCVIFYDLETMFPYNDNITQIGATARGRDIFDQYVYNERRPRTGSTLNLMPPDIYLMVAKPLDQSLEYFNSWCRKINWMMFGKDSPDERIILVAHNGFKHDHHIMVKSYLKCNMKVPRFRLCDSVLMLKLMMGKDVSVALDTLVKTFLPWFHETLHDALVDSKVLKRIVKLTMKNWMQICYLFSNDMVSYMKSLGINTDHVMMEPKK